VDAVENNKENRSHVASNGFHFIAQFLANMFLFDNIRGTTTTVIRAINVIIFVLLRE
jgi:hypothetical protein